MNAIKWAVIQGGMNGNMMAVFTNLPDAERFANEQRKWTDDNVWLKYMGQE